MAKFPEPPPATELAALTPDLYLLPAGSRLWRIYARGGQYPVRWNDFRFFGPLQSARFDHHRLAPAGTPYSQERGIYYAADNIVTCLAEYFQEKRAINRTRHLPWLVCFETTTDLVLLNLRGAWPTAAGASMAINSGERGRARRWSTAIYDAYQEVQGLWYASSMYANSPSVALCERAMPAIPRTPVFHRALSDPTLYLRLDEAAVKLNYSLI